MPMSSVTTWHSLCGIVPGHLVSGHLTHSSSRRCSDNAAVALSNRQTLLTVSNDGLGLTRDYVNCVPWFTVVCARHLTHR
jgi:hypothetical protein